MSIKKTKLTDVVPIEPKEVDNTPIDGRENVEKILKKIRKVLNNLDPVIIDVDEITIDDIIVKNTDELMLIKKYRMDIEKDTKNRTGKLYNKIVGKKIFKF